jgi:hypothetical protein
MTLKSSFWTEEENERLKAFVAEGKSVVRAAAAFKRSMINVRHQARKLGAPFPSIRGHKKRLQSQSRPNAEYGCDFPKQSASYRTAGLVRKMAMS